MTFAANVQADIDAIVAGEATTAAVYKPKGGEDVAVNVLFFEQPGAVDPRGRGARVYERTARILVSKTDVAAPTIDDRVAVAGELWNVRTPDQNMAWWVLDCVLTARVDRTVGRVVHGR